MQEFYGVVRMKGFFYVPSMDGGDEVPVCTIKKDTQYMQFNNVFLLNISLPMK